jgi:hypothetical protein
VFVFEGGAAAGGTLAFDADDPVIGQAARAWAECLQDRPRLARAAFSWKRHEANG